MNFDDVSHKFGSWAPHFEEFIKTNEFDEIFKTLKGLKKRERKVFPINTQTFRCFSQTPYDSLKAVFVFNTAFWTTENGKPHADGIALSNSNMGKLIAPLRRLYRAFELETDSSDSICPDPDLTYLANRGILLLNASLTVEEQKPGSHFELWKPFMNYLFIEIINRYPSGIPIVFFGNQAATYDKLVYPFQHKIFKLDDPIKVSEEEWSSKGVLSSVLKLIQERDPDFSGFLPDCTSSMVA
ncbi:hypothetical protein HGH93_23555 [Chitinophaga polysaccharea]|nr:hypothetical protein [Chitinophaga polysaccharea]